MKLLAASAIVLVTLCAPALGAPAPAAEALKIRFALRDIETTHFEVSVGAASPCATATEKHADRELHVVACVTGDAQLTLDWSTRSAWGEYHSTSSVPATRGATAELGSAKGPRLTVTVQ